MPGVFFKRELQMSVTDVYSSFLTVLTLWDLHWSSPFCCGLPGLWENQYSRKNMICGFLV